MKTVYVAGIQRCGLGNTLFQIAVAINYARKYDCKISLVSNNWVLYGTSNLFNKKQCHTENNNFVGYDKTLFSKFTFITPQQFANLTPRPIQIHNHLSCVNVYTPVDDSDIEIIGYNQDLDLYKDAIPIFRNYFNLEDKNILDYITKKYGDISNGICLCLRKGDDFKHMVKLQSQSYRNALKHLESLNIDINDLYVISDVPNIHNYIDIGAYKYKEINESDIVQFYFGTMCKHYILSESTFHLWIAYLGTNGTVICFNNTDITNRNLSLENWIKIDY